jgi:serine/threonine-protein kinase
MQVRDYELSGILGEGGMGRVYAARHVRLCEPVAVKELLLADRAMADQFLVEARLLYGVRHPCFPTVKDYFVESGKHYLVMDRIAGESLQSVLATHGRVPVDTLDWVVDQLLEGLDYLHARGIVHRDIKPGNVMVDVAQRRAVLVDFGIARSNASTMHTVAAVRHAYTPHMAPPEQYAGARSTPATDLYQLGATTYYAASGLLPPEAVHRLGRDTLVDIAHCVPSLGARRSEAIRRALALDPAARPASASQMRAEWAESVAAPPITAVSSRALDTYRRLGALDIRRR